MLISYSNKIKIKPGMCEKRILTESNSFQKSLFQNGFQFPCISSEFPNPFSEFIGCHFVFVQHPSEFGFVKFDFFNVTIFSWNNKNFVCLAYALQQKFWGCDRTFFFAEFLFDSSIWRFQFLQKGRADG